MLHHFFIIWLVNFARHKKKTFRFWVLRVSEYFDKIYYSIYSSLNAGSQVICFFIHAELLALDSASINLFIYYVWHSCWSCLLSTYDLDLNHTMNIIIVIIIHRDRSCWEIFSNWVVETYKLIESRLVVRMISSHLLFSSSPGRERW